MTTPGTQRTAGTAALAVVLCVVSVAPADFTPVFAPPGSEADHLAILEAYFSPGSPWSRTGTRTDGYGQPVDLTNGRLTATRVDDQGFGGVLDARVPLAGGVDDQTWTGVELAVSAVARYAGYTQELGYDLDGDEMGYIELFDLHGYGMNVHGDAILTLDPGATFTWVRDGNRGGRWSSRSADNSDQFDHMVAYYVAGLGDDRMHWMLFWEDLPAGGDRDYNDMVVEVTTATVPEPPLGLALLLAGGALALRRWRGA